MKGSVDIPTITAAVGEKPDCGFTGNAVPLLHEIRHALQRLLDNGDESVIDLQSLPMGSVDAAQLLDALGAGEVEVRLTALGLSTLRETGIAGVWFVEHFNSADESIGKFIEITHVPAIVKSQREDIQAGLQRLAKQLAGEEH